jgi:hypothetical protein
MELASVLDKLAFVAVTVDIVHQVVYSAHSVVVLLKVALDQFL